MSRKLKCKVDFTSEPRFQIGDWVVLEKTEDSYDLIGAGDSESGAVLDTHREELNECTAYAHACEFEQYAETGTHWIGQVQYPRQAKEYHEKVEEMLSR